MLVLYCFGTCVAYLIVIGNNIQSILKATNIHIDQTELVIFLTGAVIFPMACLKNLSSLRYAAIISVCSMLYVSLAMSINSISHSDLHDMPLVHVEPDVFQAITITFFAYTCHTNVFSIYSELSEPLVRRMSKVSLRAIVLEFCLYAYCAFFGYISFRDNTQGNILDNYSDTDPLFIAARGCVTIALLVALPLNFCPCRDNLDTMAFGKRPFSMSRHLAWTIGLCTAVLVVALCVPGVKIVFGILGASSSVFFCYLLPMKLYTHIFNAQLSRCTYYSIKLMQHTVVVIGAVSIYMSISDAVNGTAQ